MTARQHHASRSLDCGLYPSGVTSIGNVGSPGAGSRAGREPPTAANRTGEEPTGWERGKRVYPSGAAEVGFSFQRMVVVSSPGCGAAPSPKECRQPAALWREEARTAVSLPARGGAGGLPHLDGSLKGTVIPQRGWIGGCRALGPESPITDLLACLSLRGSSHAMSALWCPFDLLCSGGGLGALSLRGCPRSHPF